MQLPHSTRRTRRSIVFDVGDPARIAAAVYASIALRAAEGEHRVIEYVVSVKAELSLVTLRETERLRQRHIRVEPAGTTVGIASDIADLAASRQ